MPYNEAANRGENLVLLALALMAGNLVEILLTGLAFDSATGCSLRSALDQLEKNGYLTLVQRQQINARLNPGAGNANFNNIKVNQR
ncbi:MAG: hypothetical protein ACOX8S_12245 [Christensenellales bacterium]